MMGTPSLQRWAHHPWRLPALSGAVLALGYFTLGLIVPNLLGLVPLLYWIDENRNLHWRAWWKGGFAFGLALNLLILHWMRSMLAMSFLAIFAYLGLAAVFAAGLACAVTALAWLRSRTDWSFAVLLPACWLSLEWIQAHGDLRMTAQHLGHTMGMYPSLVQFAEVTGPYGVGLALLLSNAWLYEAWSLGKGRGRARPLACWFVMILTLGAYDAWAWTHPPVAPGHLKVGFVQPNIPLLEKMDPAADDEQERLLIDLTRQAAARGARVVLWPETAYPRPVYRRLDTAADVVIPPVQALARELGIELVVGAEYVLVRGASVESVYNAVFVVHADGRIDPTWTAKVDLVPFVEAVPFRPLLGPFLSGRRGWMRWLAGGFSPGTRGTVLPLDGTTIGVTVCYEELYFDLQRALRNAGAGFQAVITNDAWFGTTFFQTYQANTDRLRAIENRSSIVRVANSGISMFVDPSGQDHERTELDVQEVRVAEIPLAGPPTLYDRIGDLPAWLALAALAAGAAVAWRRNA